MKRHSALQIALGLAAGGALLALLLATADVGKVAAGIAQFPPILLPLLFLLLSARELIRVLELSYLLHGLGVRLPLRHVARALLAGDSGQVVPAGIYFSNVWLYKEDGAPVGQTLPATFAMQLLELLLCLTVLATAGVPGVSWLRPAVLVVLIGFLGFLFMVTRPAVRRHLSGNARSNLLGKALRATGAFMAGIEETMEPRVALRAGGLTAAYLVFTIAAFWVVLRAYALPNVGLLPAMVIYCFVLALVVLVPLPTDLGLSEAGGVAIFLAYGTGPAQALTVMLIMRFCQLATSVMLFAGSLVFLPVEHAGREEPDTPSLAASAR